MSSTISIATSALLALRQAMDVRAHNVANAATEGYRRQEAILVPVPSLPPAGNLNALLGGQWGGGVWAICTRHAHETYLDLQARLADASLGRWGLAADVLHQVETILQPAPGQDLSGYLDRFWNAWEAVAARPEDLAARHQLREEARALCDAFHDAALRLGSLRTSTDLAIAARVTEVNTLAEEIASLNRTIAVALAEGRAPNDDLDRRDLLLNRLAELTGAMPFTSEAGHLMVYLDGRPLIEGSRAHSLSLVTTSQGVEIRTSYDSAPVALGDGEIGGLLYARDVCLPGYQAELDALAQDLIAEVNARHRLGYGLDDLGDRDFFAAGGLAATISLSEEVLADVRAIAAAAAPQAPGDGSVARDIAALRSEPLARGRTFNARAQALLGMVGSDVKGADAQLEAFRASREQIRLQQQSVSGVSTDEEMTYLLELQRAYEAAARIVRAGDEMLRTLIELVPA